MRLMQKASVRSASILFVMLVAYFLISSFYISNTQKGSKSAFFFYTQDTAKVNVDALFDADSIIVGYKALVETPICEDTVCYAVRLYFF